MLNIFINDHLILNSENKNKSNKSDHCPQYITVDVELLKLKLHPKQDYMLESEL